MLLRNSHVELANGYSNGYWGWGHEDIDLMRRLDAAGLPRDYRYGTFAGLSHDRRDANSFNAAAGTVVRSPSSQRNWEILSARWGLAKDAWLNDGLNSLRFTPVERAPMSARSGGIL